MIIVHVVILNGEFDLNSQVITIDCTQDFSCFEMTLQCNFKAKDNCNKCIINCFGISSCQHTTIDVSMCNNVEINGISMLSLSNTIIHAPKYGNLTINTSTNDTNNNNNVEKRSNYTKPNENTNKNRIIETFSNSIIYGNNANAINIFCNNGIKCSNNTLLTQSVSFLNIYSKDGQFSHNTIYCPSQPTMENRINDSVGVNHLHASSCNIKLVSTISRSNVYYTTDQLETVSLHIYYYSLLCLFYVCG